MRIPSNWLSIAFGLAVVAPLPRQAQTSVSSAVTVASAYVWRGLTTTNRPVIQPELALSVPVRAGTLTFGGWASIEPSRYDGASDISAVYGLLPGPAFTQYSAWADFAVEFPGVTVSGGAEAYFYPDVADLAALYNTIELSASASWSLPLEPSLSVWYDIGAVQGAYLETSLGFSRQVRGLPISVALTAGVNAGQGPDTRGGREAYFAKNGVTHVELSATAQYRFAGLTFAPTAHVIHAFDPMARMTTPTLSRGTKLWLGTTVTWSSGGAGS